MIIDLILDRKEGEEYNRVVFYRGVTAYGAIGQDIASALDSGTEEDVQRALCNYIAQNGYNISLCDYIKSQEWLVIN